MPGGRGEHTPSAGSPARGGQLSRQAEEEGGSGAMGGSASLIPRDLLAEYQVPTPAAGDTAGPGRCPEAKEPMAAVPWVRPWPRCRR